MTSMRQLFNTFFTNRDISPPMIKTRTVIERRYYPSPKLDTDYILNSVDNMNGTNFELYVCSLLYNTPGYSKVLHVGGRGDNGIDIRAIENDTSHIAVQCKCQRNDIPPRVIRELNGSLLNNEIGMLVTNARLTTAAIAFAIQARIRVVDRYELFQWIKRVNAAKAE